MTSQWPVLIGGPTASGKSGFAIEVARQIGGVVINADSMQVYNELSIITSRPRAADIEAVPHRLYGHIRASERYSVGRWLADVGEMLNEARADRLTPVFVGGTGLYFRALTQGLAPVPEVPASIRTDWRERAATLSTAELHEALAERSADEAGRIQPSDRSRILRALEVIDATGRTLPEWQVEAADGALIDPRAARCFVLTPPRANLYERINQRFLSMMKEGALREARRFASLKLDPDLPATKSIGLRALLAHHHGELELDEAVTRAQTESRNYAKRQMTWFRNQMADWQTIDDPSPGLARSLAL